MIYDIAFNDSHDLYLKARDLAFINDENSAIIQSLTIRLQFLFSEWFLNKSIGVPYTQVIFKARTAINEIYEIFHNEISRTPNVSIINSLNLDAQPEERQLTITFTVNNILSNTMEIQI